MPCSITHRKCYYLPQQRPKKSFESKSMAKCCLLLSIPRQFSFFRFLTLRQFSCFQFLAAAAFRDGRESFLWSRELHWYANGAWFIKSMLFWLLWVAGDWRNNKFYDSHKTLTCLTGFLRSARYQKSIERRQKFINLVFRTVSLNAIANTISACGAACIWKSLDGKYFKYKLTHSLF